MSDFKKCPNGHYYQGAFCPYCKNVGNPVAGSAAATSVDPLAGTAATAAWGAETGETATGFAGGADDGGTKTTVVGGFNEPESNGGKQNFGNQTVFADEEEVKTPEGTVKEQKIRSTRKLVGWLVSYTLDPMGVDFKVYEGRNVIGRDMDCNITVNDPLVSSKHAVLLFRAGKYSISDQQSSHGTFVNDEDIELEPHYLKDGDVIRIGNTLFMLRFALF